MKEIWPNFYIVGAMRSGTTSLYAHLSQHPEVFLSRTKSPHFFCQVPASRRPRLFPASPSEMPTRRAKYLGLYRQAEGFPAIGDCSTSYLWYPEVPAKIKAVSPAAKIIIILRDPIQRAYSHYLMEYRDGVQHRSFLEALIEDLNRPDRTLGASSVYVERGFYVTPGLYAQHVRRYLQTFGKSRVKLLLFDDFVRSPGTVLKEVAEFLEVDPAPIDRIDTSIAHNAFAIPRSEFTRRLVGNNFLRTFNRSGIPRTRGWWIYQRMFLRSGKKPPIENAARDLLRSIYEPGIGELETMLERPLTELRSSWNHGGQFPEKNGTTPTDPLISQPNSLAGTPRLRQTPTV
jgi:hypothetical protein